MQLFCLPLSIQYTQFSKDHSELREQTASNQLNSFIDLSGENIEHRGSETTPNFNFHDFDGTNLFTTQRYPHHANYRQNVFKCKPQIQVLRQQRNCIKEMRM